MTKKQLIAPRAPRRGFLPEEVFDKQGNAVKKYDAKGRTSSNWQRLVNSQKLQEEAAQLVAYFHSGLNVCSSIRVRVVACE